MAEKENEHRSELLLLSPTEVCCSKLLLLYTPSLRPIALGYCRPGMFSPPPVFLLLSPSSRSSNHKGAGVMCLLQVRQETLPPLPSSTATSFLHPSGGWRCILQHSFKGWQLHLQQFQKVNSLRMGWSPRSQKGCYTAGSPVR